MKYSIEITPDKDGFVTRAEALLWVAQQGYSPGPVSEAIKNFEIDQRRSSDKKKARVWLKLASVQKWLDKHCHPK